MKVTTSTRELAATMRAVRAEGRAAALETLLRQTYERAEDLLNRLQATDMMDIYPQVGRAARRLAAQMGKDEIIPVCEPSTIPGEPA